MSKARPLRNPTLASCFEVAVEDLILCSEAHRFNIGAMRGPDGAPAIEILVSAEPLAALIRAASRGLRVYELMQTRRAGDLHHYIEVGCAGAPAPFRRELRSGLSGRWPGLLRADGSGGLLVAFDDVLWADDLDDASEAQALWTTSRRETRWDAYIDRLLQATRRAQRALEQSDDLLVQRELALMCAGRHVSDRLAEIPRAGGLAAHGRAPAVLMPEDVREQLFDFIEQHGIREVTCLVPDLQAWRGLIALQVLRAEAEGVPPERALALYAPDMGYPCSAEAAGGHVHVSYEGFVASALTVIAGRPDRTPGFGGPPASLGAFIRWSTHEVRFVLSKEDLGALAFAHRQAFGAWWLYSAHDR
ncbi:hypothetical protein OPU71_16830 [Niveibacterium sp. 24ML]|uniref:hypothetical protein n=1 Tax=Niveibacterium sp. 24ML TaxID=2985512 RepID=UPI00226D9BBD|nr:hypothetical protein [Niveibacterium sp. 24ML]MCX9157790.1 hypothetical protein [Niveibacterium sp. 24ML]